MIILSDRSTALVGSTDGHCKLLGSSVFVAFGMSKQRADRADGVSATASSRVPTSIFEQLQGLESAVRGTALSSRSPACHGEEKPALGVRWPKQRDCQATG